MNGSQKALNMKKFENMQIYRFDILSIRLRFFLFEQINNKKIVRGFIHNYFENELLIYEKENRRTAEKNVLYWEVEKVRTRLCYSFSYSDKMAMYAYSTTGDVAVDVVNPRRIEGKSLDFFLIPFEVYGEIEHTCFGIRTVSWGIQEALGKINRTGLSKKYIVLSTYKRNDRTYIKYGVESRQDECEIRILNMYGYCIVVVWKENEQLIS